MLKVTDKRPRRTVRQLEREKDAFIDRMTDTLLVASRSNTPIDKGRARRGWRKERSIRQTSIVNRVPYIVALEDGHSKQAPNGITKPAIRETLIKHALDRIR